jgi:hypothetical protein
MSELSPSIRPTPRHLATLPTLQTWAPDDGFRRQLAAVSGAPCPDVLLDMKLVSGDVKYWLCTRGYAEKRSGVPGSCVVGRVMAENMETDPDTGACECQDYGPDDVKVLQGFDYCNALRRQLAKLTREQETHFTYDRAKEIGDIRGELRAVMVAEGFKPSDLRALGRGGGGGAKGKK